MCLLFFKTYEGQLFIAMILVVLLLGEKEANDFSVRNLKFVHLILYLIDLLWKTCHIVASVRLSGCLTILHDILSRLKSLLHKTFYAIFLSFE